MNPQKNEENRTEKNRMITGTIVTIAGGNSLGCIRCMRPVYVSEQRRNRTLAGICASGSRRTPDAVLLFSYRQRTDSGNMEKQTRQT